MKGQSFLGCFVDDLRERRNAWWILRAFLLKPRYQAVMLYRLSQWAPRALVPWIVKRNLRHNSVDIAHSAEIGKGLRIEHPVGIVIGQNVRAGQRLTLYHAVTLGQKRGKYPVLGNNVTVYQGAMVLGGVHVGDNAVIAPGSIVLADVPEGATVVGVPAIPLLEAVREQERDA